MFKISHFLDHTNATQYNRFYQGSGGLILKKLFVTWSSVIVVTLLIWGWFVPGVLWSFVVVAPLVIFGIIDMLQQRDTVLRNFPLIGHLRYWLEGIRPEIQQYFIEPDWEGRPFSRMERTIVYARAQGELDTIPFGTSLDISAEGYEWLKHVVATQKPPEHHPRMQIGNEQCAQPYDASMLNISGMSFGALSRNAIYALNRAAEVGHFYHNTGEGGISPAHTHYNGDLVYQVGTGYFSCRTLDGQFDPEKFAEKANADQVKMVELKISQGTKPGGGGILPGSKVTPEIAEIRGIPVGQTIHSPANHNAFDNPIGMMEFIQQLRELSGGKPVGFKICIGSGIDFFAMVKAMLETKIYPDFITVDGAEGGTGAAPIGFINSVGMPITEGIVTVDDALAGADLRDKIRIIAAGKLTSEFDFISKVAIGADICNSARAMMFALGCIQARRCNTNRCPTGITTQDPWLENGLVVEEKYQRVARYHDATIKSILNVVGAAGLTSPFELRRHHIYRRVSHDTIKTLDQIYPVVERGSFLSEKVPEIYRERWLAASANSFYNQH